MTPIYAGSFDPFTIGHKNIVERILKIFPSIVIAIGYNEKKQYIHSVEERKKNIEDIFKDTAGVSIVAYHGLTINLAKQYENPVLVRGIRNISDYEAEMQLADTNRLISGIETIFLPSLPELACISSSMVRELENNDFDTSKFIPKG